MENVVLIIHLVIAVFLIAVVLLQRSEGGALGIGGGGGGMVSARGAASALSKVTWVLAVAFICTSILLTILSGGGTQDSLFEPLDVQEGAPLLPQLPSTGGATGGDSDVPVPAAPSSN